MNERCCRNCMFGNRPQHRWLRMALHTFPGLLICFHCATARGQMTGVSACGTCANFRRRHKKLGPRKAVDKTVGHRAPRGEMAFDPDRNEYRIWLTDDLYATVDPEDYEELSKYRWCATRRGKQVYAIRRASGHKTVYLHREIMKPPKGYVVDHKDGDGLNNHRDNLRVCTREQNCMNRGPCGGASEYVGVFRHRDKWRARITYQGKCLNLGHYDTPVEAAKARDRKAYELHGEFAYLNFPEDYGR